MDEKPKPEVIMMPTDQEIYQAILAQDSSLTSMSRDELESYKQYNSHFELSNESLLLEYFGADHIYNPDNRQFAEIAEAFESFLKRTEKLKPIVLVEGSIPDTSDDINRDIHTAGERGFITHLAKQKTVEVQCLEPSRTDEVIYLLETFSPSEIAYYYYLRAVRDYFRPGRMQDSAGFEEYSTQLLNQGKIILGSLPEFSDFDFSFENVKNIHKELFGDDFDPNYRVNIDPRGNLNIINKISNASSTFRDFYHVKNIGKCLEDGYSVFIVCGRDHAVTQKPSLESMFRK
jgi:hypothetical protein